MSSKADLFSAENAQRKTVAGWTEVAEASNDGLGRPQISTRKERAIRNAKAEGLSIRQTAARCGVSVGTAACPRPLARN